VYKKNEVFLDVIEKVNMIIGNQGNVIKSEVLGKFISKEKVIVLIIKVPSK
jgi:AP-1 complex subunit mu